MYKIEIDVPDGISGEWQVNSFEVTEEKDGLRQALEKMKTGRGVPAGKYKRLLRNGTVVMSNTPDEIRDFSNFVRIAKGSVLVNGLGIGVLLKALLAKDEITEVRVIEKSADAIALVANTYLTDSRVTIIHADAFEYTPEKGKKFDFVWHDIWDYITADNLPEMSLLHRKYGKRAGYQESWCRTMCERQRREDKRYFQYIRR